MAVWRKLAIGVVAVAVLWLVVLAVLGWVKAGAYGDGVAARVGESLAATGAVGDTNLSRVRGRVELAHLAFARDDQVGKLALDVDQVRCAVAPLGWALVDGTCDELAVTGLRLDASTTAVLHVPHPKHPPLHARRFVLDDAVLGFAPGALAPGLGGVAVHVIHADSGDTLLRTPLSWIFTLRTLAARLELPAGVTVELRYADGVITARSPLLGSEPVDVPVTLPAAAALADGPAEMRALVVLGKDIAERVVERRATDWLKRHL